jgi:hypothetical protein
MTIIPFIVELLASLLGRKLREVATPDELWITASHCTGLCRSETYQRILEKYLRYKVSFPKIT